MNIVPILELVLFVALPVVVLAIAVLFGWKRNIYQSGSKLAMTILSIVISVLIVKLCVPGILFDSLTAFGGMVNEEVLAYLNMISAAKDVILFVSCLVMPAVFFAVYAVISLIFLLLYLIPERLLSNKAIAKRATKAAAELQTVPDIQTPAQILDTENTGAPEEKIAVKKDCRKVWLKVATIACSVISSFLVLAFLALPISYYSDAVVLVGEVASVGEESEFSDVVEIAESISSYPTNVVYKPFNSIVSGVLDSFKTSKGGCVSAVETVCDLLMLTQSIPDAPTELLSPQTCYTLAEQFENNAFLNGVASSIMSDMVEVWQQGEAFLGTEPLNAGSPELTDLVYTTLADCEDVSTVLRLLGDILSLQKVMQPDAEGRVDALYQVLVSANPNSTETLKNMLTSETVSATLPSMEGYGTLLDSVLTQVVAIKEDSGLTEDEKTRILQQEAKSLTVVIDMVNDPANMQAENLIDSVLNSKVLTATIQDVTKNSTVKDPFGVASQLPPEFTENVGQILVNEGVAENTDLYNAFMALITSGE